MPQHHTVILQEPEFKLFETIQHAELPADDKELLIEELIRQIAQWVNTPVLSARDILQLPHQEQERILSMQFQEAESLYKEHPELLVPDVDEPVSY